MVEPIKNEILTELSKKEKKQKEKELKSTAYYKIIKKYPKYKNNAVYDIFVELPPLNLPDLGEDRKKSKMCKINLDNSIYTGEVSSTFMRDGFGYLVQPDGTYYEGYFSNGTYSGEGRLITPESVVMEGTWANKHLNGQGKIHAYCPYSLYIGELNNGIPEGKGTLILHDKTKYEGHFYEGKKHGHGHLEFSDGSYYDGEFHKDKMHGHGKMKYKDEMEYNGLWLKNKQHGFGIKFWNDGRKYTGEFKEGIIDGKGKMEWPDRRSYEGFWINERPHGIGTEKKTNGTKIEGQWINGKIVKILYTEEVKQRKKGMKYEIAETVLELQEKVSQIRGYTRDKKDNFPVLLENFEKKEKIKAVENLAEKKERINGRAEKKILTNAQKRTDALKRMRNPEFLRDLEEIARLLNHFEITDNFFQFEKILKKRQECGDFDYYDPDCFLPDSREFKETWILLEKDVYYRGEISTINFKPSGRGMLLKKREIYEGYFLDGAKNGLGREITTKYVFTGDFIQDKKCGFGVKIKPNSTFVGEFLNDLQSGTGYYRTSEASYRGDWKNGKQHGSGMLKFSDGRVYKGEFWDGAIKGYGAIIWPNGKSIVGHWENGEIIGESQKEFIEEDERPSIISEENESSISMHSDSANSLDILDALQMEEEL